MIRLNKYHLPGIILIITFCLVSCSTSVIRPPKPKNLLSESVMAEVLADVHIAEANVKMADPESDTIRQTYINYYYAVFEKHNISREAFLQSMDYYIKNPVLLQKIYEDVTEILSAKRGEKM